MVASLFVSLGRKRLLSLKTRSKIQTAPFYSAKINGVNVVVSKGSSSD